MSKVVQGYAGESLLGANAVEGAQEVSWLDGLAGARCEDDGVY